MYKSKITLAILILLFISPLVSASPDRYRDHNYRSDYEDYDRHHKYNRHNDRRSHKYDRKHGKHADDNRHHARFGKVIRVKPIYETVRIEKPGRHCRDYGHVHRETAIIHQHSPDRIILGGILGGIVGHELGHPQNREISTLAGVVIGSTLAHNATSVDYVVTNDREYRHKDCRRTHRVIEKQKLVGYKVKYKYRGDIFTTRTSHHPGRRIPIRHNHGKRVMF